MEDFVAEFGDALLPITPEKNLNDRHFCKCNFCSKDHFSGYRYKCLECYDYNLCSECFEKRKFDKSHRTGHKIIQLIDPDKYENVNLEMMKEFFRNEIHINTKCNICSIKPIKGLRYKCDSCIEFNLCENCSERSYENHQKNHPLLVNFQTTLNEIKISELIIGDQLSRNGFGTLFKTNYAYKDCVCKVIKARKEIHSGIVVGSYEHDLLKKSSLREIQGYIEIKGENVLRMIGYCSIRMDSGHDFFIITELIKSDLEYLIKSEPCLPYKERFGIATGIAAGMMRIHKMGYIHTELKPANIFVTSNYVAKIGNMSKTQLHGEKARLIMGLSAKNFMPPEFSYTGSYVLDYKLDVFIYGLTLNELFGGSHAFKNKKIKIVNKGELIFDEFISKFINDDPDDRPSSNDIEDKFSFINSKINEDLNNDKTYCHQTSLESRNRLFKFKYFSSLIKYKQFSVSKEKELIKENRTRIKAFYERLLRKEEVSNPYHIDSQVPYLLNSLRHSEYIEDNTEKCLEYCQKFLSKTREIFKSEKHPEIARALAGSGFVYLYLVKDFREALNYYEKALDMNKALFGEVCPVVAQNHFRIGDCHYKMNNVLEALEHNLKSLDIRRTIYESNSEFIVNSLNKISLCYLQLNETENYLRHRREELQIQRELYKVKHPNRVYCDIMLIRGKDNGKEAWHYVLIEDETKYEKLKKQKAGTNIDVTDFGKIIESGWGHEPPGVIKDRLSRLYEIDYPHFENFKINGKSIEISIYDDNSEDPILSCLYRNLKYEYEFNNGENNLDVVNSLLSIIRYYFEEIQDSYNCVLISDKCLEICDRIFKGEHNHYTANTLYWKACCFLLFDKEENKALVCFKEVLEMRETLFGCGHPSVWLTYLRIGECHIRLNEMSDALNWYLYCLDILTKNIANHSKIFIVYALDAIVDYYDKIDDIENYTNYRNESLIVKKELFKAKHPDRIYYDCILNRSNDEGKHVWHYILIEDETKYIKSRKLKEPTSYGRIIKSGWGFSPPLNVSEEINKEFGYEIS
jgi:serine/threonine protein kinase